MSRLLAGLDSSEPILSRSPSLARDARTLYRLAVRQDRGSKFAPCRHCPSASNNSYSARSRYCDEFPISAHGRASRVPRFIELLRSLPTNL
jgi:hypothetical protein